MRSLSGNLYTFTATDAYIACTPNRRGIIKELQKLQSFAFRRTKIRLSALYSLRSKFSNGLILIDFSKSTCYHLFLIYIIVSDELNDSIEHLLI